MQPKRTEGLVKEPLAVRLQPSDVSAAPNFIEWGAD